MPTVLHLCRAPEWSAAQAAGELRPASLTIEGFVHCSTPAQLTGVVKRFYAGVPDLLVLSVDVEASGAELRWEPPDHAHDDTSERFPHLYGPIPAAAVLDVVRWPDWAADQR